MVSVWDENNYLSKEFCVIDRASPLKYLPIMVYRAMTSKYVGQDSPFAPQGLNNHRVPAVFLIHNGIVLNEFRYLHQGDRADFIRVMIDPDNTGDNELLLVKRSELVCDDLYCSLPSSVAIKPPQDRTKSCLPPRSSKSANKEENEITLQQILDNPVMLRYFHLYAAKQYCPENLFFYQEVNFKYKLNFDDTERRAKGQNICTIFFDADSVYEINVKEKSKKDVVEQLEQNKPEFELFDPLVKELEDHVLVHLYANFTESDLFQEMLTKTSNKNKK
ncbi:hypothetical protein AKO1_001633 [Acrasis kona]|uniref:RGS domain-containing protein n=1 Tax=Acrasis kona TaxID=1008807 RepID=A0AAW2ZGZ7_9EUKA